VALIRGADVKLEIAVPGPGYVDVTCDTLSMDWSWGTDAPLGPLTDVEGGTIRASLNDPTRRYDPTNPASPILETLKPGKPLRVTVDGTPAFTGAVASWEHDIETSISDLRGVDAIGELAVRVVPPTASQTWPGTSEQQVQYVLDNVDWPVARRYFPATGAGQLRGAQYWEGSSVDMIETIRFAELGQVFAMRDGRIAWCNRAGPTPPAVSAIINCDGVGLMLLYSAINPGRVRNQVVFSYLYGTFGAAGVPPAEIRQVLATPAELQFDLAASGQSQFWDWAWTVLDALADPEPALMLGTIIPVGAQVKQVLCAEYGARWEVHNPPDAPRIVRVAGQSVTVTPGSIEVEAVTDLEPLPTTVKRFRVQAVQGLPKPPVTNAGGVITSTNDYANARAGSALVAEGYPNLIYAVPVGQVNNGGAYDFQCFEAFFRFDTSPLPDTATVQSVTLYTWILDNATAAALLTGTPREPRAPGTPRGPAVGIPVTFEARTKLSGNSVDTGDWVAGASLAGLGLRASVALTSATPEEYWVAWTSDASFKAAVNRTGYTELIIHSARQRTGTAPSVGTNERIYLSTVLNDGSGGDAPLWTAPYLEITYT
jgi:hypothetical protein